MKDGESLDAAEISAYLENKLEAYKIPKFIEAVDSIAKTYNGKINRKEIIKIYGN